MFLLPAILILREKILTGWKYEGLPIESSNELEGFDKLLKMDSTQ